MPLVALVGRKKTGPKLLLTTMYVILIIGSFSMVYPFMMTVTGSMANHYDYPKYSVYPEFLFSQEQQFFKYVADKYYRGALPYTYVPVLMDAPAHWNSWNNIANDSNILQKYYPQLLKYKKNKDKFQNMAEDYYAFLDLYKSPYNLLNCYGATFKLDYTDYLKDKYIAEYKKLHPENAKKLSNSKLTAKALAMMNKKYGQGRLPGFEFFETKYFSRIPYHVRKFYFQEGPSFEDFYDFVRALPDDQKAPVCGKLLWDMFLLRQGISPDEYNKHTGSDYKSVNQIPYLTQKPENKWLAELWTKFHSHNFPLRLIKLKKSAETLYRKYLEKRFKKIETYNKLVGKNYKSFSDVPFYRTGPENPLERNFWNDFTDKLDIKYVEFVSPELLFQKMLQKKYGSIEKLNKAWGKDYKKFSEVQFPVLETDYHYWKQHKTYYLLRSIYINYSTVFKFMATRGRALLNTIVLVTLTVLCTLTINPLAAYALSRYRLKHTQKILIFFLATMAFPPAVTMIPSFLILRDFNLLNTYGALILPRLANAYSIFLLKGFFDSLPKELYEAATIDGASELKMFWNITLQLTTPILAVLSLNAFVQAYGGFMWAFIVCQNQKMWTLMVWLYQFQSLYKEDPHLIMAALVLASIPTLIIFLFCQKIILRGIVVPSMK